MQNETNLLQFPCEFPIKAMGFNSSDFDCHVVEIVRRHAPDIAEGAIHSRLSKSSKYISITITIKAESKNQLDAIYQDLSASQMVLMAL